MDRTVFLCVGQNFDFRAKQRVDGEQHHDIIDLRRALDRNEINGKLDLQ
jgi:hypothetical protein